MPHVHLQAQDSLLLPLLDGGVTYRESLRILQEETRWHYSQHYLAEFKGEEVIEDLLTLAVGKRQRVSYELIFAQV